MSGIDAGRYLLNYVGIKKPQQAQETKQLAQAGNANGPQLKNDLMNGDIVEFRCRCPEGQHHDVPETAEQPWLEGPDVGHQTMRYPSDHESGELPPEVDSSVQTMMYPSDHEGGELPPQLGRPESSVQTMMYPSDHEGGELPPIRDEHGNTLTWPSMPSEPIQIIRPGDDGWEEITDGIGEWHIPPHLDVDPSPNGDLPSLSDPTIRMQTEMYPSDHEGGELPPGVTLPDMPSAPIQIVRPGDEGWGEITDGIGEGYIPPHLEVDPSPTGQIDFSEGVLMDVPPEAADPIRLPQRQSWEAEIDAEGNVHLLEGSELPPPGIDFNEGVLMDVPPAEEELLERKERAIRP